MGETRIGFGDEEPSAEWSAISVADVQGKLPRLQKKLAEYTERNEKAGIGYIHPELLAMQGGILDKLKPAVLESVLDLADGKSPAERVYLHQVAVLVQDKTGLDVTRAATVPFRYSEGVGTYLPDYDRLMSEAGIVGVDFAQAYGIIRGYCGDMRGVIGGTGLPEA